MIEKPVYITVDEKELFIMPKEKVCAFSYRDFDEAEYFHKISDELNIELVICGTV